MPYDENGYWRDFDGKLRHRKIAFREYLTNKHRYPLPFSQYIVHHIDGNKKNNHPRNLQIMTQDEHEVVHGLSHSNYPYEERSSYFLKYWLPAFIAIGGLSNYNMGILFEYIAIIGIVWFCLAIANKD